MDFEDYRTKIRGRWTRSDNTPIVPEDQQVEQLEVAGLEIRLVDQRGTQTPREGPPHPGWRLIAAHPCSDRSV